MSPACVGRAAIALAATLLAGSCGPVPAREVGAQLFADPRFAGSDANAFSCATCHATADDDRILPGADLRGAFARPSFWGGYAPSLLEATNACLTFFMRGAPLEPADVRGRALYEYLVSLEGDRTAQPLSIVENVRGIPRGDPARGARVWDRACASCHGAPHTGAGRITELASRVPEDSVAFAAQSGFPLEVVITEKVRHGAFFGVGGTMPPFSIEALSDEDLGALNAFLVPGGE
jgi:thiosulfate dehydrogenase